MYIETLIGVIVIILFGLCKSTQDVLEARQHQRDLGNDPKIYL